MPWYKTGTVSVTLNSNAVTGTGTAFIVNCRVGDAFRGPDGRWYEVTNVASNTAISIDPPYLGATASGGSYALAPMQGYVKESADALRAIVTTYGAQLAALKTTGNYDLLPVSKGGTGITDLSTFMQGMLNDPDAAAGRATLVAAKSGANSDITSLAGLTTALSIAQGGTGNSTGTATKLATSVMVGTVSQSAGVPTGALMEVGSNANGSFEKYACGTLICRDFQTVNGAVEAGAYISPTLRLPITPVGDFFCATDLLYFTLFDGVGGSLYASKQGYGRTGLFINTGRNSSSLLPSFTTLGTTTANSYVYRSLVIGRWF